MDFEKVTVATLPPSGEVELPQAPDKGDSLHQSEPSVAVTVATSGGAPGNSLHIASSGLTQKEVLAAKLFQMFNALGSEKLTSSTILNAINTSFLEDDAIRTAMSCFLDPTGTNPSVDRRSFTRAVDYCSRLKLYVQGKHNTTNINYDLAAKLFQIWDTLDEYEENVYFPRIKIAIVKADVTDKKSSDVLFALLKYNLANCVVSRESFHKALQYCSVECGLVQLLLEEYDKMASEEEECSLRLNTLMYAVIKSGVLADEVLGDLERQLSKDVGEDRVLVIKESFNNAVLHCVK